jgi:uncharacterized damage-inducible protein DinB
MLVLGFTGAILNQKHRRSMTQSTHLNQFRLMARYNTWANDRVYELVSNLSEEERQRNLGAFFNSIHGTLNHILLGDRAWLGRFATSTPHKFQSLQEAKLVFNCQDLGEILYPNFAELRKERSQTDRAIENWTNELTPEMLSARMNYKNITKGIDREHSLWFALAHFFNHQTHHRSQVTTLLHQLGKDYGITDFLAMYDLARDEI